MKTAEQILLDAAALIRKGWTKGAYARNASGAWCVASEPQAVCWCLDGAILAASGSAADAVTSRAYARVEELCPEGEARGGRVRGPVYFNDYIAKDAEEVAQLLERAARMP